MNNLLLTSIPGSHKKRDNRCAIAAPKLEHGTLKFVFITHIPCILTYISGLTVALEREGWEVNTQLEDPNMWGPPLEDLAARTPEERVKEVMKQLKAQDAQTAETKRALILRCSHIGGHKFAGNCIVRTCRLYIDNSCDI